MTTPEIPRPYIGRFAPSPTGLLHFGSLVSALASYLDARHNNGKWLVRIEDLDPPREAAGAASGILQCLEDHGLSWDDTVIYQSQRAETYENYLAKLQQQSLIYPCVCTRQQLQTMSGIYDGRCRTATIDPHQTHALRLKLYDLPDTAAYRPGSHVSFVDLFQEDQQQDLQHEAGDQIVRRKEGLYAYQLAVVVDDIEQQISHIIRGSDLLEVTARQIFLYQLLGAEPPQFGHVTLATHPSGQKLSKQNFAPALKPDEASENLWQALLFLGQNPPLALQGASPAELLAWANVHWQRAGIRGFSAISTVSPRDD